MCCRVRICFHGPGAQQPIRLVGLFPRHSAEDFFNPLLKPFPQDNSESLPVGEEGLWPADRLPSREFINTEVVRGGDPGTRLPGFTF